MVKIEFQDSNIKPMIFHVNVQANDLNSKTLSNNWPHSNAPTKSTWSTP